jgi:hypothetical protein
VDCKFGYEFVSLLPHQGKIENNVAVDCKTPFKWSDIKNGKIVATPDFSTGKNIAYQEHPGFKDAASLDFRLTPDAKLLKDLPGFEAIPVDRIGLHTDEYRKVLPNTAKPTQSGASVVPSGGLGYDILDRQ